MDKLIGCSNLSTILIVSYEMISRAATKFADVAFDLLVCDEAHRLKNLNGRLREQVSYLSKMRFRLTTEVVQGLKKHLKNL